MKNNEFNMNWYELWMQQSKLFFDSANQHLGKLFTQGKQVDPKENIEAIQQWMDVLKKQWLNAIPDTGPSAYWKMGATMCSEAMDTMLAQWIKRTNDQQPINNVRELYELWLSCCQAIYQKSLRTEEYQEAYSQFMNAALKMWKQPV